MRVLFFGEAPFRFHKVRKKREDFLEHMCYYSIAESGGHLKERRLAQPDMKKISPKKVVEELAAIGFARATDFLRVSDGELTIRSTDELSKFDQAAIASMERTSSGIRLKFYDKMKALELLGKYLGMFDGIPEETGQRNDLLEAILAATGEVISEDDIPELQQAAADCHDLVEPAGSDAP